MSLEAIERRIRFLLAIVETRREKLIKAEEELEQAYADYREQGGDRL